MARDNILAVDGFAPAFPDRTQFVLGFVASGYGTAIYPGQPLLGMTDGSFQRTPAGSASGAATDGITAVCVDIVSYKDTLGFVRRNAKYLPASTTWTADSERSQILVALCNESTVFRCRANAASASITVARALSFANCDHVYGTADTGLGLGACTLNVSTANTTNTLQWRVVKWEDERVTANDPTVTAYTLLVTPNLYYAMPIVGQSATAI